MKDKAYYENYFIHKMESFKGEQGHEKLVTDLIFIINDRAMNTCNETDDYSRANYTQNLFIDVGSCVGHYTGHYTDKLLKMSDNVNQSLILSFEPNSINYKTLVKNKNDKVVYRDIALSNKKSTGLLYNCVDKYENLEGNQHAHINNRTRTNKQVIQKVEIDTLENILDEMGHNIVIRFMKIDTEGNDTNVIKGLGRFISSLDMMVFECSDCLDDSRGPNVENPYEDIIRYLDNNNFYSFMIGTEGLLPVYGYYWSNVYEKNKQWSNVFSISKDLLSEQISRFIL